MSTQTHDVHISGIAPQTTEQHIQEFFSFCGKIVSIDFDGAAHSAVIRFEKPSAARTALMLNDGTLDGAHLSVTSPTEHQDHNYTTDSSPQEIDQTDKPRSAIAAEYLARGYTLSDQILQKAIAMDNEKGISKRFLEYFQHIDRTVGEKALGKEQTVSGTLYESARQAGERAKQVDQQKGISNMATEYYTRALSSPWGQKVKAFYTTTTKQVLDIHEEAKRLSASQSGTAEHNTTSSTGVGSAAPPLDSAVHSTAEPLIGGGQKQSTSGGDELQPKTIEAPTVM